MTRQDSQESSEQIFGPLIAESWLVSTGRAVQTDEGVKIRMPQDSLGEAALGIMLRELPPVLSTAYEHVAEVAVLSRGVIGRIARTAAEDYQALQAEG